MSAPRRFRLAYRHDLCPDRFTRPPPPHWLRNGRVIEYSEYNLRVSYSYWTKLYWATPPWLTAIHLADMARTYGRAGQGDHVDHVVPLKKRVSVRLARPLESSGAARSRQHVEVEQVVAGPPPRAVGAVRMTQTRKQSAVEAVANVGLGVCYTAISLACSYCLRRFYNWFHR